MDTLVAQIFGAEQFRRAAEFFQFEYSFVINAVSASIVVGALCAVVGSFLVLKGMSLIGDATGHATLPGVCVAFLFVGAKSMGPLLLGALVSGFLASLLVGFLSQGRRARPDAAIGVVLSVFFGIGILFLSYVQNSPTAAQSGLQDFLFGNAAGVDRTQLFALLAIAAVLLGLVYVFYRPLVLTVFDPDFARSVGIRTGVVDYALLGALSVAVVVSIQAVGVVLVSAMLIIPPSAALFVSKRMHRVVITSGIIGAVSGFVGSFFSFIYEGVATGPSMVLAATAIFVVCLLFGPRGLLFRGVGRRSGGDDETMQSTTPESDPVAGSTV